jgi:hypothetical protein
MLGLGPSKEEIFYKKQRLFEEEMKNRELENQIYSTVYDPTKFGEDSQVSARILDNQVRFLKWEKDETGNRLKCKEEFGYIEPWGEEPVCFLDDTSEKRLVGMIDYMNQRTKDFFDKRGLDGSRAFNQGVLKRLSMMTNSRATGKSAKVAKSQYVESAARISRSNFGDKESGKDSFSGIGGLFK